MGSSARPFAAQIDAARTQVARARQRLLHPAVGTLEAALPDLERAILLLRESEGHAGPAPESGDLQRARELKKELAQVKTLARQAQEFYAMKIRLLAQNDSPADYDRHGALEIPLKKGLIVHG